jgi:hypothetical protein
MASAAPADIQNLGPHRYHAYGRISRRRETEYPRALHEKLPTLPRSVGPEAATATSSSAIERDRIVRVGIVFVRGRHKQHQPCESRKVVAGLDAFDQKEVRPSSGSVLMTIVGSSPGPNHAATPVRHHERRGSPMPRRSVRPSQGQFRGQSTKRRSRRTPGLAGNLVVGIVWKW